MATDILATLGPFIALVLTRFFPEAVGVAYAIVSPLHAILGAADALIGLFRTLGGWAATLAGNAISVPGNLAGGIPNALINFGARLVGTGLWQMIHGLGEFSEGMGWALISAYYFQEGQPIWEWCEQNQGKCDPEPQNYVLE